MKKINWSILFILLSNCTWAQNAYQNPKSLVPVTAHYSNRTRAKQDKSRTQVRITKDSIEVWGFNYKSLPKNLRSIRSKNPSAKFNRNSIQAYTTKSLDSTYNVVRDTANGFRTKIPGSKLYEQSKGKFINGAGSSSYLNKQWIRLASMTRAESKTSFNTKGFILKHGIYQVENLPAAVAWELPALDPWYCAPVEEEFFRFRKMAGYGLDKFKYVPYEVRDREIIRKSFELYFERNEAKPNDVELQTVIGYLEQNQYAILNATLEGATSAEGSKKRNEVLQAERAKVLSGALKQYNETTVKKDTILLTDPWPEFRKQVIHTSFAWLDTLANDEIRERLNQNDSIRMALEPILKTQRKAVLKLVMVKRLSEYDKLENLRKTLALWASRLKPSGSPQTEIESMLMGIIDYLFQMYQRKEINQETFEGMLMGSQNSEYLQVLLGYHIIKQFQDNSFQKTDNVSWKKYWEKYNLGYWFLQSNTSLNYLLGTESDKVELNKYLKMYNDFQAYTYRFIDLGLIDINTLCDIRLPQRREFMGLILNQYAFLYEMANEKGLVIDCVTARKKKTESIGKDSVTNIDTFLEGVNNEFGARTITRIREPLFKKPTFNTLPKGAYYFLLKQHFLKGNKEILNWTETKEGGYTQLDVFNLYHLVSINVFELDPFENSFYDKEVQLEEMDRLITQLKKRDGIICRPQINALYLEYHLKALYYLERYFSPGNEKQVKIADASLNFITEYYKKRCSAISPRLSLHIIKQLNLFNWLPSSKPGAMFGYDLLNTIAKQRILTDEELKLFAHYKKMYDPQFKTKLPIILTKEKIVDLWDEEY